MGSRGMWCGRMTYRIHTSDLDHDDVLHHTIFNGKA